MMLNPSQKDIECICRYFSLGKLKRYKKEKNITFPHANSFIFASTTLGPYAFKFYPTDAAKTITVEYAINRILIDHHFQTPVMFAGIRGQPFFTSNNQLVACYSYIDGHTAWNHIKEKSIFPKINTALLSLKNILSTTKKRLPIPKNERLMTSINTFTKISRALGPYNQKETIDTSLLEACRTYQHHRALFTRQYLHPDANLTNFLIHEKNVYTLDLSHIAEDYILCDLSSLLVSCLLSLPASKIKGIIKDYFSQHNIGQDHLPVLNTLVKIGLVKEYLGEIQRERSTSLPSKRKESIAAVLKKMNNNSRIFV